ncbi:hypothetical protein [Pararhodospirillum photometricum]|uniref:hypothetical protein n=1 Tax=Pararhodospirillum photometricum TaxID=1084 RepID=UPI000306D7F7|nr:hypothetical protein [Pararhodospirillum photometricum]
MDIKTALVGSLNSSSVGADGTSSSSKTSASEQFLKMLREQVTPVQGETVPTEVSRTLIRGVDSKETTALTPSRDKTAEATDDAARAAETPDADETEPETDTAETDTRVDDPPSSAEPPSSLAATPPTLVTSSLPLAATVSSPGEASSMPLGTTPLSALGASPSSAATTAPGSVSQPQPTSETAAADVAQTQAQSSTLAPLSPATSAAQALTASATEGSAPVAPTTKTQASPLPPKADVSETVRNQAAQLARTVDGETTVEVKVQTAQATDSRPSPSTTASALPLETPRALETNGNAGFQGGQTPGGQTGQGGQGGQTGSSNSSSLPSSSTSPLPDSSFTTQWLSQAGASLDGPDAGFLTPAQAQAAAVSSTAVSPAPSGTSSSQGTVSGGSPLPLHLVLPPRIDDTADHQPRPWNRRAGPQWAGRGQWAASHNPNQRRRPPAQPRGPTPHGSGEGQHQQGS